ncbi:Homocysteine S-methyltransferase, partial [human gut metagenome]
MDQPDIIKKIHISYLAAGADIIQSSGYQATVAGFKGLGYGTEEA